MPQEEQFLPYAQIIEALKRHCIAGDSGTLFITTDANEAIRFVLNSGNIVSMALRRERGMQALDSIRNVRSGRYKFSEESVYSVDGSQQLPGTKELLTLLLSPSGSSAASSATQRTRAAIDNKSSVLIAKDTLRKVIKSELIEQMGPIGGLICEDHLESLPENSKRALVEQLIRNISIEIGSDSFRENVAAKLFG